LTGEFDMVRETAMEQENIHQKELKSIAEEGERKVQKQKEVEKRLREEIARRVKVTF